MCWSKGASLISFIIGSAASIALIIRNKPLDRLWGIFFLFVITMQLFEFLIWSDQPKNGSTDCETGKYNGKLNNAVSQISSIQNFLQPFIIGILILFFISNDKILVKPIVLKISLAIYFIGIIVWIFNKKLYQKKLCTIPCKETGCYDHNLQWQWTFTEYSGSYLWFMYIFLMIFTCSVMSKVKGGLYLTIYLVITLLISLFVYPFKKSVGSWWCVLAVLGPVVKLLIPADKLEDNVF
jgi:hypothetical protein